MKYPKCPICDIDMVYNAELHKEDVPGLVTVYYDYVCFECGLHRDIDSGYEYPKPIKKKRKKT